MTAQLRRAYPLAIICRVLRVPRSSVSIHDRRTRAATSAASGAAALWAHIESIAATWPTSGYRRVTARWRREAEPVRGTTGKRVRRLLHELGLTGNVPTCWRCRTTNSTHPYSRSPNLVRNLEVGYPDHVWVGGITSVRPRLEVGYLAVFMSVCTRAFRGGSSRALDHALTVTALERVLEAGHVPALHHSDHGVQYAAAAYTACLERFGVRSSMAEVGSSRHNGYAERLMQTINEEEVDLTE